MPTIDERISEAIKDAMRAKNQLRLDVLRGMKSSLKYKFVEKEQVLLTEEETLSVFQSMIKQRKESVAQYEKFDRPDQAAKEKSEIEIISEYLPQALSEPEIKKLIQDAVQSTGATSPQDMGKVMKVLKGQTVGRADSKMVADLVRAALG